MGPLHGSRVGGRERTQPSAPAPVGSSGWHRATRPAGARAGGLRLQWPCLRCPERCGPREPLRLWQPYTACRQSTGHRRQRWCRPAVNLHACLHAFDAVNLHALDGAHLYPRAVVPSQAVVRGSPCGASAAPGADRDSGGDEEGALEVARTATLAPSRPRLWRRVARVSARRSRGAVRAAHAMTGDALSAARPVHPGADRSGHAFSALLCLSLLRRAAHAFDGAARGASARRSGYGPSAGRRVRVSGAADTAQARGARRLTVRGLGVADAVYADEQAVVHDVEAHEQLPL
jgi:hypothetical protein